MRNFSSRFLHFFFFAFFFNMQRIVRRKMSGREPKNGGREGRENRKEGRRDDEAGTNGLRQPLTAQKLLTLFFSETSPKNEKSSERPRFFFYYYYAEMREKFAVRSSQRKTQLPGEKCIYGIYKCLKVKHFA